MENIINLDEFLHFNGWCVVEFSCDMTTLDEELSHMFGSGYMISDKCVVCDRGVVVEVRKLVKELS